MIDRLPFVSVVLSANNRSITIEKVLLDTGSAGSLFSADLILDLGLKPSPEDKLHVITGVGGDEYAFSKILETVSVGPIAIRDFEVEVGAMDYKVDIDGILGMSFLTPTKAKIDLEDLTLSAGS